MNLYPKPWSRFRKALEGAFPERVGAARAIKADPGGYEEELRERVEELWPRILRRFQEGPASESS